MKKRKKHLTNARQCRKFLSKIVNEIYANEIEADTGRALFYGISILLKSIEVYELEERIIKLENLTNGQTERFKNYQN